MIKDLICIECPKGCVLSVDIENCRVVKVMGNQCPKGEEYAVSEIEDPRRILTTTVLTENLSLKMLPVRTDGPIPKNRIFEAINEIRKIKVNKTFHTGDVVIKNLLGMGVNLIATRNAVLYNKTWFQTLYPRRVRGLHGEEN